jgi:hypothetical protein
MKLSERHFNSHQFRPRPVVHQESDQSLILIATSWGQAEASQRVVENSLKYIQAARSDLEVTSPFEFLPQLTAEANALRVSALLSNDFLYRTDNKTEYNSVVEFVGLSFKDHHLSWVQVGFPNLYFKKRNGALEPISVSHDLSFELEQPEHPLPLNALGIERDVQLSSGSIQVRNEDQLVILSRSLALNYSSGGAAKMTLQGLSQELSQNQPEVPFWLGLVDF